MELLSLEHLKLSCNNLLLALAGCAGGRQAGVAAGLTCAPLIVGSKSWQILIYSHAALVAGQLWNSVKPHRTWLALWRRMLQNGVGSYMCELVFLWRCCNRDVLKWKICPDKRVSHLLILPGLRYIALKLESLKEWNQTHFLFKLSSTTRI